MASILAEYGDQLPELIRRLPEDGVFIDIGANTGIFSLLASKRLRRGQVISFEPNRYVFKDLLRNIELNGCENIVPVLAAVGSDTGLAAISFASRHSGGGSLLRRDGAEVKRSQCFVVGKELLSSVAEICRGRHVLCKIDTEGMEAAIIKILADAGVLDEVESLFVEIDPSNLKMNHASASDVYSMLDGAGFRAESPPSTEPHYDEIFRRSSREPQALCG